MRDENKFVKEVKFMLNVLKEDISFEKKLEIQTFLNELQKKKENIYNIYHLLQSQDKDLVFFSLQIMERQVDFNWEILSLEEKNYVLVLVSKIIYEKMSFKLFANKFPFCKEKIKHCLVKIVLKFTHLEIILFIKNLIETVKLSEFICETNFKIINIFFEEIHIKKNSEIKRVLSTEYMFIPLLKEIEKTCQYILEKTHNLIKSKPELLNECLNCLGYLIKISPISYYLEDRLLVLLVLLCPKKETMNNSLNCLINLAIHENEINGLSSMKIFMNFILQFQELLPFGNNICEIYKYFSRENKQFIMNTITLIKTIFKNKTDSMEFDNFSLSSFCLCNQLIVKFTSIPSIEIYKICLTWWLQMIEKNFDFNKIITLYRILDLIFFDLRIIIICRMAKPEEVFIKEEENGEIVNEKIYETETFEIYKKSKKILLFLANIDKKTTQKVILKKLSQQLILTKWNRKVLNTISWAMGSIAEIFSPKDDMSKLFFVSILKNLLYLCELKKKKKDKAVIASNIMFVVGQYPDFLKNHWKFCKTVIEKLFEFIREPVNIPGFKDMACDTFFRIVKNCGKFITKNSNNEGGNFLGFIFDSYSKLGNYLQFRQKKQFLCSIATITRYIEAPVSKKYYLSKIGLEINREWLKSLNLFELHFLEVSTLQINKFIFWIKTNIKVLNILGNCYFQDFEFISKNFYYLIFTISEKLIQRLKETTLKSFDSEDENSLVFLKKNLFSMLLKYIKILNQRKSFIDNDRHLMGLIIPIFFYFNKQKSNAYFDELVLYFTLNLFQNIEFFKNLKSFRFIYKEILIFLFENREISRKFPNFQELGIFRLLEILINNQFSCLLKLDSDTTVSQKLFKNIMYFLGRGIEHGTESICQNSLKIFENLLKKIEYLNLEEYFIFNFSEMFLGNFINCSFNKMTKKSKKKLVINVLNVIFKLKIFLDFEIFNNILTNLFLRRINPSSRNELSGFIFSLYSVKNVFSLNKQIELYLNITTFSSFSTITSEIRSENSLSDFPVY
jgi:hypothetical protein